MAGTTDKNGGTDRPFPGFDTGMFDAYMVKDPQALAENFARALENAGKAASAWLAPRERGEVDQTAPDPVTELVKTVGKLAEYWMSDPQRTFQAQTLLLNSYMEIWMRSLAGLTGQPLAPEAQPQSRDRRFADEDWTKNPFFSVLRQVYKVTSAWAEKLVTEAEGLSDHERHKAAFYVRQLTSALSPSNFAVTNPEVYRETIASHGTNLVAGMKMLADDIARGSGTLRLRQTDVTKFAIGENIAVTPGKVVARNALCEVLQYEASTETVLKRPLLIVPPWINKFYILDLGPEKSFIKWCVDQGHTVFVISWVNPDSQHAQKDWEAYMREGIDFALDTIGEASGETEVNAVGYCVGGTLLAATLSHHAKTGDHRIATASFMAAQVDFVHAGDLKVFVDEEQVSALEQHMELSGYLDGTTMATVFNMLRASELIWPYMVNAYLRGREPLAFDLLYWNADSTRITAANHAYYLRNCYLDNRLSAGEMVLAGETLSLKDITIPAYNLATRDDHIAPARSVFAGSPLFGGPVEFVLSASGHIAGVVNAPARQKYQYWTGGRGDGSFDDWLSTAEETSGSWWPHWQAWIEDKDDRRVGARRPGGDRIAPLGEAPGTYVLVRV